MKIFLMVTGLLMTAAGVYGVIDYNQQSKSQSFKELYKEKPVPVEEEVLEEVPAPLTVVAKVETLKDEKPLTIKKKVLKKKNEERKFRLKEFSRSALK